MPIYHVPVFWCQPNNLPSQIRIIDKKILIFSIFVRNGYGLACVYGHSSKVWLTSDETLIHKCSLLRINEQLIHRNVEIIKTYVFELIYRFKAFVTFQNFWTSPFIITFRLFSLHEVMNWSCLPIILLENNQWKRFWILPLWSFTSNRIQSGSLPTSPFCMSVQF